MPGTPSGPYCVACVPGPACPGCIGDDPRFAAPPHPAKPKANPEPPKTPPAVVERLSVGGQVQMPQLVHRVVPAYPTVAKQIHQSGVVHLAAIIGIDGGIRELRVVSGPSLLITAAMDAVKQWVYSPTLLNQKAVEVEARIDVSFILDR